MTGVRQLRPRSQDKQSGFSLVETLFATAIVIGLLIVVSIIYFACLRTYLRNYWQLPPYDTATRSVDELTNTMRKAMLVEQSSANTIVVVLPKTNSQGENILELDGEDMHLVMGDQVMFYLSNESGTIGTSGHCLWKAVKPLGMTSFTPRRQIAEDIYPEHNPTDPSTCQPKSMFKYWPDDTRLWGIEITITAIASQQGQHSYQTAVGEIYLRNL